MPHPTPLDDKVALVTGAASGIGNATARLLARDGAAIAAVDISPEIDVVAEKLAAGGATAKAFRADMSDADAVEAVVADVLAQFGHIDVLVACAGTNKGGSFRVLDPPTDEAFIYNVNVRAPVNLTRLVGAHMIERGQGGKIVHVSSSAAFRPLNTGVHYAGTKAFISQFTRTAAGELGPHGINVNAVAPGLTKTPMTASAGGGRTDEDYVQAVTEGPLANLLHRPSEAEDVAEVIAFLCSPASRQITGQTIHTCAGLVV
jgi:NAD(P)-dependent dehydrogenase (short-subunit alcohol dehydrogenase family)